jgi:hypothetical protein
MIRTEERAAPQAIFQWHLLSKNYFQILAEHDLLGTLALSLEPSILFKPARVEYFRAMAQTTDGDWWFKCFFSDGDFKGCVAVEEGLGQPLALFETRTSRSNRNQGGQIVLCPEGTTWQWVPEEKKSQWTVKTGGNCLFDIRSITPHISGLLRVYDTRLLQNAIGRTLLLFSIFLSIGPKRLVHG